MASQLAAAVPAATGARRRPISPLVRMLVDRRVPISVALFATLICLDVLVFHSRPRDLFNLADPLVVPGLLLIVAGLLVRSWAAGTLRKRQQLATTGPYAWVRNPLYAGSFLMMIGFGLLVQDALALWIVVGPIAWLYWQAVQCEERNLNRLFPEQWPPYAASVPRFFPRRLMLPRTIDWSLAQWLRNSEYQAWGGSLLALAGIKLWQMWL
jgi:protein-S-isoprenylcysteine O-methyltransferase Ste14